MTLNIDNSKYFDKSEVIETFYRNYATNVAPILDEYEKKRKIQLLKITAITLGILAIPQILLSSFGEALLFNGYIWCSIIALAIAAYKATNFTNELKSACIKHLISCFGDIKWVRDTKTIGDYELEKSELFSHYNTRSDDDSFTGTYKGVEYAISEIDLTDETRGHRKISWPVFYGVVIKFASNKNIKNKTIITTREDLNVRNSDPLTTLCFLMCIAYVIAITKPQLLTYPYIIYLLLGAISVFFLVNKLVIKFNKTGKEKLNEITLEDPEFCKRFQAYSSDEIEGRYLITTAFMSRFQNLQTAFGAKKAKCAFYDDTIMFALSTRKNLFEIGTIFTPVNTTKQINVFLSEISAIFDLIDYFKLDEKTGI